MIENFFEIHHEEKNSLARTGVLHLPHGDVQTPVFMPVGTKGTVKALTKDDLDEIGFEIILANTYHLYLRPGEEIVNQAGGLHGFSGWKKNFLTDSGGFQVWSLSNLTKIKNDGVEFRSDIDGSRHFFSPEKVVQIQSKLNSDIQMQLDVCSGFGVEKSAAQKAMKLSADWAVRAINSFRAEKEKGYGGFLFPIVQGNFFDDLRKESALFVDSLETEGLAIGGLSVGEPEEIFREKLKFTVQFLSRKKPKYVMGIGTPEYILEAVEDGIDMFDCVQPTRIARHGLYFSHRGMISIKQKKYEKDFSALDEKCSCKVCKNYSRAYLRHLFREQEILSSMLASYHNLFFLHQMILEIRSAINRDEFSSYKKNFLAEFHSKEN
jgi:queuine tRNA-ribosyltransferase